MKKYSALMVIVLLFTIISSLNVYAAKSSLERIKMQDCTEQNGIIFTSVSDMGGGNCAAYLNEGDFLKFNSIDFGKGVQAVEVRVASPNNYGIVEIRIDSLNGKIVAKDKIINTGDWQKWESQLIETKPVYGVHDVYVVVNTSGYNLNYIQFYDSTDVEIGKATKISAYDKIEAEYYSEQRGTTTQNCNDEGGGTNIAYIDGSDYLKYEQVDFGDDGALGFEARIASLFDGAIIDVRLDSLDATPIITLKIDSTGNWQKWTTAKVQTPKITGVHDVYLYFGDVFNFNWFRFLKEQPDNTLNVYHKIIKSQQINYNLRETYPDTWVGVDNLKRQLLTNEEVGNPKKDKFVAAFYFLIHSENESPIYDNTKLLKENPKNPKYGPVGTPHYWAEPYFGYYHDEDPYIIRKHAQMLTDAMVDVIALDVSNCVTYPKVYTAIFEEYAKMRNEGLKTPQIMFFCGEESSYGVTTVTKLYNEVYTKEYYPELWFYWKGKPMILANTTTLDSKISDFFTIRRSWAWDDAAGWFGDGKDKWPWIQKYPQSYGWHDNKDIPEETSVAIAEHPIMGVGRSNSDSKIAKTIATVDMTAKGIYFEKQWERALEINPEFIFITSWNEWAAIRNVTAQANTIFFIDKPLDANQTFFVDSYNQEFSRDAEPMRGGFGDNYYYQMVNGIRKFKGLRPNIVASEKNKISFDNDFSDWDNVKNTYYDDKNDANKRDFRGFGNANYYKNSTGRNDFVLAKAAYDENNLYFYAQTANDITSPSTKWMTLYLNTDADYNTGWNGYDYVINRNKMGVIEKNNNGYKWDSIGEVNVAYDKNQLNLSIPKNLINVTEEMDLHFKWADNSVSNGNIMEFIDKGDVAPNGRFNYRFSNKGDENKIKDLALDTSILLKPYSNIAIVKKEEKIIDRNIDIVPVIIDERVLVPVRFVAENMGADVEWDKANDTATITTINKNIVIKKDEDKMIVNRSEKNIDAKAQLINDKMYVPLRAIAEAMGKYVYWDNDVAIISDYELLNINNYISLISRYFR